MATKASALLRTSALLRAARKASLRSRAGAAAASRAAVMASRSARVAGVAGNIARAARLSLDLVCHSKSCSNCRFPTNADYEHLPDDCKIPTDKDLELDEVVWVLYERWCKAFDKKRDCAEMVRRFKIFRHNAEDAHSWNTVLPADPEEAAIICLQKRREAKLLLAKGEDVSHFDECHLPAMLGPLADGGDPFLRECDYNLLKDLEKREARCAPKNVIDVECTKSLECRKFRLFCYMCAKLPLCVFVYCCDVCSY